MKTRNYIYTAALVLILSACNKQLNINPKESVDQGLALKTSKDVQGLLVGTYNRLAQADLYGGGVFLEPDLLANEDFVIWRGTYQPLTDMANQAILRDNSFVESTWLEAYEVINQTNTVLANLDKADDDDQKAQWEGQAKFMRGLTYFDLVRLYGKAWNDGDPATNLGVPIVLTPTTSANSEGANVGRSTVKQAYDQAISDLTAAEDKLPEDNDFYANKYAASAILARLYLQQGDYTNAVIKANEVIASGMYHLLDDYTKEFLPSKKPAHAQNSDEDIFAMQVTEQQGTNDLNLYYASSGNGGRGDVHIDESFIDEFDAADVRGKFYNPRLNDDGSVAYYRTKKFDNIFGNVHIARLAEMYLIRAEGNLRNGTAIGDTPLKDVNRIRVRAGIAPLGAVTLDDILTERRHELAFEGGFFLHDAKRLKNDAGSLPFDDNKLVFPIPQREIYANPKLVQNPGY